MRCANQKGMPWLDHASTSTHVTFQGMSDPLVRVVYQQDAFTGVWHMCIFFWNCILGGSTSCKGSLLCFMNSSWEIRPWELLLSFRFCMLCQAWEGVTLVEGRTCWVLGASQWGDILTAVGCTGRVYYGGGKWTIAYDDKVIKASDRVCT